MSNILKYLDKNGLNKILTLIKNWDLIAAKPTCRDVNGDLVPGQKIVELTKAQYDALATKDPDTYYMVNDDNDPKTWYPRPDTAHTLTPTWTADGINRLWTAPADGMLSVRVTMPLATSDHEPIVHVWLNNTAEMASFNNKDLNTDQKNNIIIFVGQGDVVKVAPDSAGDLHVVYSTFVPWK